MSKKQEVRQFDIEFVGVDYWSRPGYKVVDKDIYFGSVDVLVPNKEIFPSNTVEEINDFFRENQHHLVLFGSDFDNDNDPDGRRADNWIFNIIG